MGFNIPPELRPTSTAERLALRQRLGLPAERQIVVSVAALNFQHKRLDYLIDELAALPPPRPFLLLVGQPDAETADVRARARERLAPGDYDIRTSPPAGVPSILRASNVHVLASLAEMQARALIEAAAAGTPCIVHDSPVTRFALGEHGAFGDFTRPGALRELLVEHLGTGAAVLQSRAAAAHRHAYERFSWQRLVPRYVELLAAVAANSTVSSSSGE